MSAREAVLLAGCLVLSISATVRVALELRPWRLQGERWDAAETAASIGMFVGAGLIWIWAWS